MHQLTKDDVRRVAVAGLFYPAESKALARQIDELLVSAPHRNIRGDIKALISPHAGYDFSGVVAAAAYARLLADAYRVVAIISPSHREDFPGVCVFTGQGYETPMGIVPVASGLARLLADSHPLFAAGWTGHTAEHGLEVQLPFLQRVLSEFEIIPIVVGRQSIDASVALGDALGNLLSDRASLIVASSDLSHNYPYEHARLLDARIQHVIKTFDESLFYEALRRGECQACGWSPIIAAMRASKLVGADRVEICDYRNSGDVTGELEHVVGYMSAAFFQTRSRALM